MPTLSQAIAARGIDEQAALKNIRRRKPITDGRVGYIWPRDNPAKISAWRHTEIRLAREALMDLRANAYAEDPPGIRTYVASWCELNHLKVATA